MIRDTTTPIHVRRMGAGPPVVLVHGTLTTSQQTWARQEPLAARWSLVIPDRRGYPPNPPEDWSDFEVDAADIAPLLGDGAHLVGHSYGGLGAMFAAALRPEAVRSLTLVEAPALALVRGEPAIEERIARQAEVRRTVRDPEAFMRTFLEFLGAPLESLPSPLTPALEQQVRLLMGERAPWDLPLPIDVLARAGTPVLVVSGGHDEVFESVADRLADALGPRAERAVITGRGHVVQRLGQPFNDELERFMLAAGQD